MKAPHVSQSIACSPREVATVGLKLAFGCLLLVGGLGSIVQGQQRTFVSGLGLDNNPCTRTAPCRTFGQAISMTNPGGEVIVLDSAGYGPVVINKSISLIAPPGVYAGISVFSGDGITINAGASDTVILRGLTVNDQNANGNGNGVIFNTGDTLHVENCVVNGFSGTTGTGLAFMAAGHLEVKDSIFRDNASGIVVFPASGQALATIDAVRLEGTPTISPGSGVIASAGSKVTVSNSLASGYHDGFIANAGTPNAEISVENCVATGNFFGIQAISNTTGIALARVSNSIITHNTFGLLNSGSPAVILSRTDNTLEANTTNTSGTISTYTAK